MSQENSSKYYSSPLQDPLSNKKSIPYHPIYAPELEHTHQNILKKYGRQLLVKNLGGLAGYSNLSQTKVLIIGAGGIGSSLLYYLASSGLNMTVVDGDTIEESNLHRQIIHDYSRIGMNKAESACLSCLKLNSLCKISFLDEHLSIQNVQSILDPESVSSESQSSTAGISSVDDLLTTSVDSSEEAFLNSYDLVLDATDNIETRLLLNDFCVYKTKVNYLLWLKNNALKLHHKKKNFMMLFNHLKLGIHISSSEIEKLRQSISVILEEIIFLQKESFVILALLENQIELTSSDATSLDPLAAYMASSPSSSAPPAPVYQLSNYILQPVQVLISAAAITMDATITTILPFFTPCYRCINFPSDEEESHEGVESTGDRHMINSNELAGACSNLGVFGPIPGLIGIILAIEAFKVALSLPKHLKKDQKEKNNDLNLLFEKINQEKFFLFEKFNSLFIPNLLKIISNFKNQKDLSKINEKELNLLNFFHFFPSEEELELSASFEVAAEEFRLGFSGTEPTLAASHDSSLDVPPSSVCPLLFEVSSLPSDFFVQKFSFYNNSQLIFDANTGQFHTFALSPRLNSCRSCSVGKASKSSHRLDTLENIQNNLSSLKSFLQENRKKLIGEIRLQENNIHPVQFLDRFYQRGLSHRRGKVQLIVDVRSPIQFNLSNLSTSVKSSVSAENPNALPVLETFSNIDECLIHYEKRILQELSQNPQESFSFGDKLTNPINISVNIPLVELKKMEKVKNPQSNLVSFSFSTLKKLEKLFYLLYNKFSSSINLFSDLKSFLESSKSILKPEESTKTDDFISQTSPPVDFFVLCRRGNDSVIATNFLLENFLAAFTPVNVEKGIEALAAEDSSFAAY